MDHFVNVKIITEKEKNPNHHHSCTLLDGTENICVSVLNSTLLQLSVATATCVCDLFSFFLLGLFFFYSTRINAFSPKCVYMCCFCNIGQEQQQQQHK